MNVPISNVQPFGHFCMYFILLTNFAREI